MSVCYSCAQPRDMFITPQPAGWSCRECGSREGAAYHEVECDLFGGVA